MTLQTAWGYDGLTYTGKSMRYLAELLSQRQGGVLAYADMKAVPSGTPDNKVHFPAGSALIQATAAAEFGFFEVANDADLASPSITATGANGRWDLVLLQVVAGVAQITVVAGTAAVSPAYPSLAGQTDYIVLCGIKMPANKSIIDNGANGVIDDRRSVFVNDYICTSTTRPPIPYDGQMITETDTDRVMIWDATSGAWKFLFPVSTAANVPTTPPAGTMVYVSDANAPLGQVVFGTGRANTPGMHIYAGATSRYNPPWNQPWGILGYVQVVADQGSITSVVDLTSLTLAITYVANRRVRIRAKGTVYSSIADDTFQLSIKEGATQLSRGLALCRPANTGVQIEAEAYVSPTAAAHTYKLTGQRAAGTGTCVVNASSTDPFFIEIEDVGPNGQPS